MPCPKQTLAPWSRLPVILGLALALLLIGCKKDAADTSPDAGTHKVAPGTMADVVEIKFTAEDDHLLFTYLLADGSFQTVESMEQVPKEARSQVMVIDTRLSPEQRNSSSILYVADLTFEHEDGTFHSRPVSRFKLERDLLRDPTQNAAALPQRCKDLAPSPRDKVILYSASWCGVCKTAAAFLTREGIPFQEIDIESVPGAEEELSCRALQTGTRINGVPVLDIGGKLLLGFDRDDILRLVKEAGIPRKG